MASSPPGRSPGPAPDSAVDVVVIGAGVSGLIAARQIERQGYRTTVLEAAPRIGGRCQRQQTLGGWWLDLGGQWMGRSHHLLQALSQELGLQPFESFFSGDAVLVWNGTRVAAPMEHDWAGSFLDLPYDAVPAPAREREAARRLHHTFLELVESVEAARPWLAPAARSLDTETAESWMRRHSDCDLAHAILRWYTRVGGSGGFEPGDTSILHLAQTQKASPQGEGPETWLLDGAVGQIPQLLAAQLQGRLHSGAAAQLVERQADGRTRVRSADGSSHLCRAVVVAIPPPLRSRIRFDPALPPEVTHLGQRTPMGAMIKVLAVYPSAWWREQGLNGYGQGNLPTVALTADSSPPSGRPGVLAAFVAADRAIQLGRESPEQRRQAILHDLVSLWGPRAGEPLDYIEKAWAEEGWVSGGFTAFCTPGTWTSLGRAWREPVGTIVWAGTEASPRWAGYYEGAIQAGLDAAQTIQQLLG